MMDPRAPSTPTGPGKWRTIQRSFATDYEWMPDLVAISRRPWALVPGVDGVVRLDFTGADTMAEEAEAAE